MDSKRRGLPGAATARVENVVIARMRDGKCILVMMGWLDV